MGIKNFFSSVGDTISSATGSASEKLDNAIEITKIKKKIEELKREIENIYTELGKSVIKDRMDLSIVSAHMETASELIDKKEEEIRILTRERITKEGKKCCPYCDTELSQAAVFCSLCGKKVKE